MKECQCLCKEIQKGPKEWKGLTQFRIAELDTLRGLDGHTSISFVMAENKETAIKKFYEQNPGASHKILIYPEGCANIYERPIRPIRVKNKNYDNKTKNIKLR